MRAHVFALWTVAAAAAVAGCADEADLEGVVARAGDHELTVDQVVALLVDEESLPAQAAIVERLADLWIDYTLLAEAVAEDSTFSELDLEALVRQQIDQAMIYQLRDSVIQVDTFIAPDELRGLYEADSAAVELRARHIMLTYPVQATPAQRDSVRARLEALRERIVDGESFEDIARNFSQDRGSAASGGDLGFFGRGDMVLPFEQAVLELEPGEVSEVVETPMGLHLIRLEERRTQDFDQVAPDFRARVQARRNLEAESTFVAGLEARATPEVTEGAAEVVRELARNPGMRLSGRAAGRPLVEWEGGAYSVREMQTLLQLEQQPTREQIAASTDEELDTFLRSLARRDLLLAEARMSGLEPPRSRVDSLVADATEQLREAARALDLVDLDVAPGERRELAIGRAVREALADNLSGATPIVPLGLVGFQLREGVPIVVSDAGVGEALLRIGEARASRRPSPLEEALDTASQPADTLGR